MRRNTTLLLLVACCATLIGNTATAQRITVSLLGNGNTSGYSGDGGSAKFAEANGPHDVCMDAAGNLYFVDNVTNVVRKIYAANGVVTTIAGGGTSTADGVPAVSAAILPQYLCIDPTGNIYITTNQQIRRIDAVTGLITSIAGGSIAGSTGDGGPAISALLYDPQGICFDATGNIYFVDQGNDRIRKISTSGIITTIAGTGATGFSGDGGLALSATLDDAYAIRADAAGNIFFSDQGGTYVREIDPITGIISLAAGNGGGIASADGGPATATAIGEVYGIFIDSVGDIYLCDGSCSCTKVVRSTGLIYLEAGTLSTDLYNGDGFNSLIEEFNWPGGMWVDPGGNIYIADCGNHRIRKAILLTHTPTFAYGKGQTITPCSLSPFRFDSLLIITDVDSAQTETWTVITSPAHGTLSGFPAIALSNGQHSITTPIGVSYTPSGTYAGLDSFRIQVSDGALSDTLTMYVSTNAGAIAGPDAVCSGGTTTAYTNPIPGGTWSLSNANATVSGTGMVSGVLGGNDTLVYSITNTCGLVTTTKAITIDAGLPDDPGAISGLSAVCIGSTINLGDAAGGGVWTASNTNASISASGVVSGTTAGTDSIVYSLTNACGTVSTAAVITVAPAPDAGSVVSHPTVCIGMTIQAIHVAGMAGEWSVANGNSTISATGLVTGVSAGPDTILYNVTNSCGTAMASWAININDCNAGVNTVPSNTAMINVYPNPASSVLNIDWNVLQPGSAEIILSDVTGREILKTELSNMNATGSTAINISDLKDGIYLLSVNSDSVHYTGKVVINN